MAERFPMDQRAPGMTEAVFVGVATNLTDFGDKQLVTAGRPWEGAESLLFLIHQILTECSGKCWQLYPVSSRGFSLRK